MRKKIDQNIKDFELLFKEHYTFLCLVAFSIIRDKDASKDVVQDFYISYWRNQDKILLVTSFKSYASKAVKNLSLQFVKKKEKENRTFLDLQTSHIELGDENYNSVNAQKLEKLLNKLPEKRKQIFVSFVIEGQSYSEIAENNGISINTVKTQMKRAYKFLRSEASDDLIYFILIYSFLS